MIVGVVGLGLIGGSMAKAYAGAAHRVLADDLDRTMLDFAMLDGTVSGILTDDTLAHCDLLFLAVPPRAAIDWLTAHGPRVSPRTVVLDLCGTKRVVCDACFPLAKQYGFTFVGGHPMAGTHFSGYKYASAGLFQGAPMVLVPPEGFDMALLDRVRTLLLPAGFGKLSVTTAADHDRMIAFTSQMCHVVSNAYIKSPTALEHRGFSAGSYKDLTRVAWLNAPMWAELMLENRDNMLKELDVLIENLQKYRTSVAENDFDGLRRLLQAGKERKEQVDGT